MENDLFFLDDNASCSSSLSATASEDVDELRLGAEATMYSPRPDDGNGKRKLVKDFVIAKQHSINDEENDLNYSYSTISSIPDLIDARNGDPEDLLFKLGFAPLEGEESRSSILSRFTSGDNQGSGSKMSHDQQPTPSPSTAQIGTDFHDGIVKTREWLNNQDGINNSPQQQPASSSGGSGKATNGGTQSHPKRAPAQKKRIRWSRSRQSSFEHLLPNLEEEATPNVADSDQANGTQSDGKTIGPIRESSQEKEDVKNLGDNVVNCGPNVSLTAANRCEVDNVKNEHERSFCSLPCHHLPNGAADTKNKAPSSSFFRPLTGKSIDTSETQILTDVTAFRPNPLKRVNLATAKVDSFELEEIISNDGCSPNFMKSHKQTIAAAVASSKSTSSNMREKDTARDINYRNISSPSPVSSDSSSGFDEGEFSLSLRQDDDVESAEGSCNETICESCPSEIAAVEHVVNSSQSLCFTTSSRTDIDNKPNDFLRKLSELCAVRSKIVCASGIAEYALLQRNTRRNISLPQDNQSKGKGKFNDFSPSPCDVCESCQCSVKHCNNFECQNDGDCKWKSLESPDDNELPSTSKISTQLVEFSKDMGKAMSPIISRSCSGIISISSGNGTGLQETFTPGLHRLYRYSSMPTVCSASGNSSHRRQNSRYLHSHFSTKNSNSNSNSGKSSSLMSNISDVTYLSSLCNGSKSPNDPLEPVSRLERTSQNCMELNNIANDENSVRVKYGDCSTLESKCSQIPSSCNNNNRHSGCWDCTPNGSWTAKMVLKHKGDNLNHS